MSSVWGIHGGRTGDADSLFLQKNYIGLGWDQTGDLRKLQPNRAAFKANIAANYPHHKAGAISLDAGQLYRFVYELKIGDLIAYFSRRDRLIYIGEVTSDYLYDTNIEPGYPHLRVVNWLHHYPRTHFTQTAIYELSSAMSFFRIKTHAEEFRIAARGKAVAFPVSKPASSAPKTTPKNSHSIKLFISYRRKTWPFTQRLVADLKKSIEGEIFIDLDGIDETNFEHSLLRHLKASDVVLVVLSEYTFAPERIHREDDWVRREIAVSLEERKQIVLINIDGANMPKAADIPENIRDVVRMQAIPFYADYWDAAIIKLVKFISSVTSAHLAQTPEASPAKPAVNRATLTEAMKLLDANDYDKAIFLLTELRDAGFRSTLVNITDVLKRAILLQDSEERNREAQEEYDTIAALATGQAMIGQAKAAWTKFQQQFPDFADDVENLAGRLGTAPSARTPPVIEPTEQTTRVLVERYYERRDFWTGLLQRSKAKTNLGINRTASTDHWLAIASGRSGIVYNYLILMEGAGLELNIDTGDRTTNKAIFDALFKQRSEIETEFGEPLDWRRMDDKKSSRIVKMFEGQGSLSEPEKWSTLQETMIDALIRMDAALRPRLTKLRKSIK